MRRRFEGPRHQEPGLRWPRGPFVVTQNALGPTVVTRDDFAQPEMLVVSLDHVATIAVTPA